MSPCRALPSTLAMLFCHLASCARWSVPTVPAGALAVESAPAYQLWWQLTEECSGRTGALDRIAWYAVPGATHLSVDGALDGLWMARGNIIVLADSARLDGSLVRHEMLHAMIGATPGKHPREMFLERCGGIVACDERCVEDAGPPALRRSAVVNVPPESLVVEAHTTPASPSGARFGGYFALVITARNTSAHRVSVVVPHVGNRGAALGFGFRLKGNGLYMSSDGIESDPGVADFDAGAAKSYVFDLTVQGDRPGTGIPIGPVEVVGRFADHEARTPWTFVVRR